MGPVRRRPDRSTAYRYPFILTQAPAGLACTPRVAKPTSSLYVPARWGSGPRRRRDIVGFVGNSSMARVSEDAIRNALDAIVAPGGAGALRDLAKVAGLVVKDGTHDRSETRRGGKEVGRTGRFRWW